jgi:hypothetical protein
MYLLPAMQVVREGGEMALYVYFKIAKIVVPTKTGDLVPLSTKAK